MVGRDSTFKVESAFLAIAFCLCSVGCRSIPFAAGVYVTKSEPFLIAESSKEYGWGVLSHPRIIALDASNIILRFYVGGESNPHESGKRSLSGVSPAVSFDGGRTWVFGETNLEERLALASRYWGFDAVVDGSILISDDQGTNAVRVSGTNVVEGPWDATFDSGTNGFSLWPFHRAVRRSDGALVGAGHRWVEWKDGKQKLETWAVISTDTGKTWSLLSRIAGPEDVTWAGEWEYGMEGPNEPCIVSLPDGGLLVICRTGMKVRSRWDKPMYALRMLQATSYDGGRTWRQRCMNIEGVFPKVIRMNNGVLVLAFGRPGNNLIFSTDGGRTWGRELALTPADVNTSGYCDVVEVSPGKLLVVFDAHDMDLDGVWLWEPKKQNGLFGVFVTVRRFL